MKKKNKQLNEEEIIPYTAEQKQAYNLLKQLYTYKGITYVFFTNDFSPKADVIYRKDVENIFTSLGIDENEVNKINNVYDNIPAEEQLAVAKASMRTMWEAVKNDSW